MKIELKSLKNTMLAFFAVLVAVVVVFITYYRRQHQYWKNRGLPYVEPSIPLGNLENSLKPKRGLSGLTKFWYNELKKGGNKHGGIYLLARPFYMPIDLEYVKDILTKDFSYFTDRGTYYDEVNEPLTAHLFALGGVKWRNLRVKMTPTFTTGKMKMMFEAVSNCGKLFQKKMDQMVDSGEPIDIKDATSRFTTDIIASCAFGLEAHSLDEKESPFRKYGKKIFDRTPLKSFLVGLAVSYPGLGRALHIKFFPKDTSSFFMDLVKSTVSYREKHDYRRNDFLQILVDLKNNNLETESGHEHDGKTLNIEEVAAQCFVFFVAGFETSSTLMTFTLLELSRNQDIQDKVRKEVREVLKRYDGQMTYDALSELKYMQQVLDETLRLYPPVPFVTRECIKDYKVHDSDLVLEKGIRVWISVIGIHHDEKYYPNPEKFDPERFSEENRHKIPQYAFIPFGEGPRMCIGMRFAFMQTRLGLSTLLANYKFSLDPKTDLPIKMDPTVPLLNVKGGVWLRAEKL